MAESTKIQWTTSTFNPWRGCTKVSPGCAHCYAETQSKRNPSVLGEWGPTGTRVLAGTKVWNDALKWNLHAGHDGSPHRVFCASLADVFEDWPGQMIDSRRKSIWRVNGGLHAPVAGARPRGDGVRPYTLADARQRLWHLIEATPHLTWQLLTKRPENIAKMMPTGYWPNVWLGTSVESNDYKWRLEALRDARTRINCPVGFVSYEPALGPLDLSDMIHSVEWVIVGGESGVGARPFYLEWVRSVISQCRAAGIACFVKQLGAVPVVAEESGEPGAWRRRRGVLSRATGERRIVLDLVDAKGGDELEWPDDVRVREFPLLTV